MAINLFAPNDNGLVNLAGMRADNLNLPVKTVDYGALNQPSLNFMMMQQQAQNELQKQQIANQGQLNVAQLENKGRLQVQNLVNQKLEQLQNSSQKFQAGQSALQRNQIDIPTMQANIANQQAQQQTAQQTANTQQFSALANAQNQQGQLGIAQQTLKLQQQEAAQKIMMQQFTGMMALQDRQLKQVGALGSAAMYGIINAQSPEQQQQVISNTRQHALDLGIANKDNIDQLIPSDPSKFMQSVQYATAMAGNAADAKSQGMGIGLYGNIIMTPNAAGGLSAAVPLSQQDIEKNSTQISNTNQQISQAQDLLKELQQNGQAWDTGLQDIIAQHGTKYVLDELPQAQQQLLADRANWYARAQNLNINNVMTNIPGFKPNVRNQQLVSGMMVQDKDPLTVKAAKLQAMIQLGGLKNDALNNEIFHGRQLQTPQLTDANNQGNNILNNYSNMIGQPQQ